MTSEIQASEKTAKETTIVVNGREKAWPEKEITYEQVVRLAYDPVPSGPLVEIVVTYMKAEHGKQGTLVPGESVKVHKDMVFVVRVTDKS